MNKKSLKLLLISIITFIVCSCYTLPPTVIYTSNINTKSTYEGDDVIVNTDTILVTDSGYKGFMVTVENNSSKPITINYSKSSISYLNTTELPFVTGMKYADAGTVPPSKTIPTDIKSSFSLYSPNQPYFTSGSTGGWQMQNIYIEDNSPITILICIEIENEPYYWTSTITYNSK